MKFKTLNAKTILPSSFELNDDCGSRVYFKYDEGKKDIFINTEHYFNREAVFDFALILLKIALEME